MDLISVLLADSQYLVRAGFRHLLSTQVDIQVVGETGTRKELFEFLSKSSPSVLVVDHCSLEGFQLKDIELLRGNFPETHLLIISSDRNKENIFTAIDRGISSYLTKHCSADEILNAIYSTAKGEKFFCNKILDVILAKQMAKEPEDCKPSKLTDREVEILTLIARGMTTKEIAGKLQLSFHTVNTHRRNIKEKLNVRSSSELVVYAMNEGII